MLVTASGGPIEITTIAAAGATTTRRRWRRARVAVPPTPPAVIQFTWANRRPGTAGFARWTAALDQRIREHGLSACARDVDNLVAVARRHGVAPAALAVLAETGQTDPARCRAFALVVAALVSHDAG